MLKLCKKEPTHPALKSSFDTLGLKSANRMFIDSSFIIYVKNMPGLEKQTFYLEIHISSPKSILFNIYFE